MGCSGCIQGPWWCCAGMLPATYHPRRHLVTLWYPNPGLYTITFIQGIPTSLLAGVWCFGVRALLSGCHMWYQPHPSLPGSVHPSLARLKVLSYGAGESRVNFIISPRAVKA